MSAAPYNFDVYRDSIAAAAVQALTEKTERAWGSAWLLYQQTTLWPDHCMVSDVDGETLLDLEFEPDRTDCAIPGTVDESPEIQKHLEDKFPESKGQYDLGSALNIVWWLLRQARAKACREIKHRLAENGLPLGPKFYVTIAEEDDFDPDVSEMNEESLEPISKGIGKVLKKNYKEEDAPTLARAFFKNPAEQDSFTKLFK